MRPTIEQVCYLADVSKPEKKLLLRYHTYKRDGGAHFLRWLVFIITFGQATLNKKLDRQVKKILQVVKENLQSNSIDSLKKLEIVEALNKLIIMSRKNFGKKHHLIRTFIQQLPIEPGSRLYTNRQDPTLVLPPEIMQNILARLDSESLGKCEIVSKGWKELAFDDLLWKKFFYKYSAIPEGETARELELRNIKYAKERCFREPVRNLEGEFGFNRKGI